MSGDARGDVIRSLFTTLIFTILVMLPIRVDRIDAELDDLFRHLQSAQGLEHAQFIEKRPWNIWHTDTDFRVNKTMAIGILNMQQGVFRKSLAAFKKIVAIASSFAGGWNNMATVY